MPTTKISSPCTNHIFTFNSNISTLLESYTHSSRVIYLFYKPYAYSLQVIYSL